MAAILLAFASGGAGATEPLRTLTPGILLIGTYFVNPPFEYVAHHARIGFEVDLMGEIAQRIGLKPAFVNTRWEVILKEMQHGRYDCIVGGITITPERERILAWSPQRIVDCVAAARQNFPELARFKPHSSKRAGLQNLGLSYCAVPGRVRDSV